MVFNNDWISVKDGLPKVDVLVLVKETLYDTVALGSIEKDGNWNVQPFLGKHYLTFTYVKSWQGISNE